jgi:predicted GIY-YIG superfamily endonuclease
MLMGKGGKKSAAFDKKGIESLSKDKPIVYQILNEKNKNVYTGSAKRGRVEERLKEHLPSGSDPIRGGAKVKIQQKKSIDDAQKSEDRIIKKDKPAQNKRGK